MAFSAANFTTDRLSKVVTQVAHGFSVGDIVVFDGGTNEYTRALADSFIDSAGSMMVSYKYDANTFAVTQDGFVFNIVTGAPFDVTKIYWLSTSSPGDMQTTAPVTAGQINLPCFIPVTTTSGYFWGGMGTVVGSGGGGGGLTWQTITVDTALAPNNGYFADGIGLINLTLPAAMTTQQQIQVIGISNMGYTLKQRAGQITLCGSTFTTLGTGGSIASSRLGDCITIQCDTDDLSFVCDPRNSTLVVT